jgi:hypothetical protein
LEKVAGIELLDETLIKEIDALAGSITKATLKEIDRQFDKPTGREVRKELTRHFWCDLFVSLAQAIALFEHALDKVSDWVTDAILASPHGERRASLTRPLVKAAVKQAWKPVRHAIEHTLNAEKVLLSLRVLSILCCPNLDKHPAVVRYCLIPLGNEVLENEIKEKLRAALSEELTEELNIPHRSSTSS